MQSSVRHPNAKAVTHQNLDAIASLVGIQIGMTGLGFDELSDDTRSSTVARLARTVYGFHRQPNLVDTNQECNKRNQPMALVKHRP